MLKSFINGTRNNYIKGKFEIDAIDSNNWTIKFCSEDFIECKNTSIRYINNNFPYNIACKIAGVIESMLPVNVEMDVYAEPQI